MLFEGVLQIESNDPNGTVDVELSGYGDIETNIEDFSFEKSINIYPNPVRDILYIKNKGEQEIYIYDLLGKERAHISDTKIIEEINVSTFSSGIYLVKIIGNKESITRKIEVSK